MKGRKINNSILLTGKYNSAKIYHITDFLKGGENLKNDKMCGNTTRKKEEVFYEKKRIYSY